MEYDNVRRTEALHGLVKAHCSNKTALDELIILWLDDVERGEANKELVNSTNSNAI